MGGKRGCGQEGEHVRRFFTFLGIYYKMRIMGILGGGKWFQWKEGKVPVLGPTTGDKVRKAWRVG